LILSVGQSKTVVPRQATDTVTCDFLGPKGEKLKGPATILAGQGNSIPWPN
jgi:hypothetical protein